MGGHGWSIGWGRGAGGGEVYRESTGLGGWGMMRGYEGALGARGVSVRTCEAARAGRCCAVQYI